jgi:hypothetical protein
MSLSLPTQIDAAYTDYYSVASEAELVEESVWADFAMEQFAAVCNDEDSCEES